MNTSMTTLSLDDVSLYNSCVNNSVHCMPGNTQSKDTIKGNKDYFYFIEAHICGIANSYYLFARKLLNIENY